MRYSRCGKEVADEKKLCPGRKRKRAAIWGAAGAILVLLLTVAAGPEEPQRVKMDKEEESAAKERRLIRKTEYSEDGTFRAETIYEYDEMGRKKKAVRYEADGTVVGWGSTDYEYDEAGNMIREVRSDYDRRCEYSESGQLLRETGFMFGVNFYDYRYDYNRAGGALSRGRFCQLL